MYPSKLNWHKIVLQTKTFNLFPGSIKISSISKILSTSCNRDSFDHILNRDLWLNRPYFEISNSNKRDCQKIDCCNFRNVELVPKVINSRFVIIIEIEKEKLSNKILWMRKQSPGDSITFAIENIIEETNNGDINHYRVTNKLNEFKRNGRSNDDERFTKRTVQQPSSTDIAKRRRGSRNLIFFAKY